MSFLAPFYLLAGLAIGLPIAFHLIRRTPQGRELFSSVMFLSPSPPRMTRRSRIEDWLLLLLRALAICLLAFAFARPFLRAQQTQPSTDQPQRHVVILLDTSASMRRTNYWKRAQSELHAILDSLSPRDSVAVMTFNKATNEVISFQDWNGLPPASRQSAVRDRLKNVAPGWKETEVGTALLTAATSLADTTETTNAEKAVYLISDMQAGAGWDQLAAAVWPEDVTLHPRPIEIDAAESNAAITLVRSPAESNIVRVRVSNAAYSTQDMLSLDWRDSVDADSEEAPRSSPDAVNLVLSPGESRVVQSPPRPEEFAPTRLVLSGDSETFDNTVWALPPLSQSYQIVVVEDVAKQNAEESLRFFVEPVFPETPTREMTITHWKMGSQPPVDGDQIDWLIIGDRLDADQLSWVSDWLRQGGEVLFVARTPEQSAQLYDLLQLPSAPVEESATADALLGRVDFRHPVLRPFDDPRYSDFTKLRFWHERLFDLASFPDHRVLLEFEDQHPALMEISAGQGSVMLLASGWNRNDSDLAVWSKFVPLMYGLLEYVTGGPRHSAQLSVGDSLPMADLAGEFETVRVLHHGEETVTERSASFTFDSPGIYEFRAGDSTSKPEPQRVAVNLAPEESRTEPYPLESLGSSGIPIGRPAADDSAQQASSRQLLSRELESRQQWWRWIVLLTLAVLFVETLLAAIKARRSLSVPAQA